MEKENKRQKLHIPLPVIVEGKYDKIRLANILDATVIPTAGFGIFNSRETAALIRALGEKNGVIVLTDSDGAGTVIRSRISAMLPPHKIHHLYIPQIPGKERRKSAPSKAGTLGVEGMEDDLLYRLFQPFAAEDGASYTRGTVTKADLYALGLSGTPDCTGRRDRLAAELGLPAGMTPGAFLSAVNILFAGETFFSCPPVLALMGDTENNNDNEKKADLK